MSAHEDTPSLVEDELARRRKERESADGDQPLRERVRDEARRTKRRLAAANRARERTGPPPPSSPFGGGDGAGAA